MELLVYFQGPLDRPTGNPTDTLDDPNQHKEAR